MHLRRLAIALGTALAFVPGCSLLGAWPKPTSVEARWAAFPAGPAPVSRPVTIYWNDYAVPHVQAETDEDGAFGLGLVHAHLRLGQLGVLRRVAQGRLAEMGGPLAVDLDKTVRSLDLPRAARALDAALTPDTRRFVQRFVDGINYYQAHTTDRPTEYSALRLTDEPWTVFDVLLAARVASVDISMALYHTFFLLKGQKGGDALFATYLRLGGMSPPSYPTEGPIGLEHVVTHMTKSGSNSIAIGGKKTKTGAALMANDPHLGVFAPNMWVLAGLTSPSYHVVGLMFPGLPFFGIGRNERVAWGGTNMRGISSHLYRLDASEPVEERTEVIKVRGFFDSSVTIRTSAFGPLISGTPFFPGETPRVALRWMGHEGSDELSAFLAAARARSWPEFRRAFAGYAVSAQNLLYADADGHIGQVLAYRQPILWDPSKTLDLFKTQDNPVDHTLSPVDLPELVDPPSGFIASANNLPTSTAVPIAFTYANPDRILRLQELASATREVTLDHLKAWQGDVLSRTSLKIVHEVTTRCPNLEFGDADARATYAAFAAFDGQYRAEARGPVAFEAFLYHLANRVVPEHWPEGTIAETVLKGDYAKRVTLELVQTLPPEVLCRHVREAVSSAASTFVKFPSWGAMHVQRFQHPLGMLPLIGSRFVLTEYEAPGSNDTLLRAAHPLSAGRVTVSFGACARHLSDLSDPDANYFVLLGGQDGWLSSDHLADQVELWRRGEYLHMPLSLPAIQQEFRHVLRIQPEAK